MTGGAKSCFWWRTKDSFILDFSNFVNLRESPSMLRVVRAGFTRSYRLYEASVCPHSEKLTEVYEFKLQYSNAFIFIGQCEQFK